MSVEIERFVRLVNALPECDSQESTRYTTFRVRGRTFGHLWPDTATVGLKQTLLEQAALVAERPEVFEVRFTAGGFGWVVVRLDGIDLDELSELTMPSGRMPRPSGRGGIRVAVLKGDLQQVHDLGVQGPPILLRLRDEAGV